MKPAPIHMISGSVPLQGTMSKSLLQQTLADQNLLVCVCVRASLTLVLKQHGNWKCVLVSFISYNLQKNTTMGKYLPH